MPDALELPRMLGAVVPHVSGKWFAGFCGDVIHELVALAFGRARLHGVLFARRRPRLYPGLAAVIGALNDLPEPAAGLRGIHTIRVHGRSLEVIDFPARKMRAADIPLFTLAVRRQDECAFACSHQ